MKTNSYFSLPTVSDPYGRVRMMRPSTIGYIGQDDTADLPDIGLPGGAAIAADPTLLFSGLALLAIGTYFLGGKHEPRRQRRKAAKRKAARELREHAKSLDEQAKSLEKKSGIFGFF